MDHRLLRPATAERLGRAHAGSDEACRLQVGELAVGVWGVLDVAVTSVAPERAYNRRRGGQGRLCRVTLADATGEIDLVLWDDEIDRTRELLATGAAVHLKGATVKEGWKGGLELGLGAAVLEAAAESTGPGAGLQGTFVSLTETAPIAAADGGGVRFQAELVLETLDGPARVVLWDDAVRAAQALAPGAAVSIEGASRHPVLDGWWLGDGATIRSAASGTTVK